MQPIEGAIRISTAAKALDASPNSVRAWCYRYGIPVLRLGPRRHALRVADYRRLLEAAAKPASGPQSASAGAAAISELKT
jgi:hypothetical protein